MLIAFIALAGVTAAKTGWAEPDTHTIVIEAMQFTPQILEVKQGDTVIWVNKDLFPHNATATDRSFQSSEIGPEGSWKFSAAKKGEHAYACTLHPPMKAKLIVK